MKLKHIFLYAIGAAAAGLLFAHWYFSTSVTMAATGLIALSLTPLTTNLLESNRDRIWIQKENPWKANSALAVQFLVMLSGILTVALTISAVREFFTAPQRLMFIKPVFSALFIHNLGILLAGALLSVVFRAGALVLILGWNAILWSESITGACHVLAATSGAFSVLWSLLLVPHLFLELGAYIIAGLSGVFVSKALTRYQPNTFDFFRVTRAALVMLIVSIVVLAVGAGIEVRVSRMIF